MVRGRVLLADRLRFSPLVRWGLYQWRLRFGARPDPGNAGEMLAAVETLCGAARLADTEEQILSIERRIEALPIRLGDVAARIGADSDRWIRKAAILKPFNESTGEPGVVFISFEYEWAKLLGAANLDVFSRRYLLVVSPTWTPPHSAVNWVFPRVYPAPVYCLISNLSDLETFPRLSANYRMIDLFASNWVDPDLFSPRPAASRDIDLIMLANFGEYKRHHVLFRALRALPKEWKVVLVGQPNGDRTAEVLMDEADAFGVRGRFELRQRVSDQEVCDLLGRSRVSLICSRREGSCVAVVESMFAGTPVALLAGAGIGSGHFIHPATGAFLDESKLAGELIRFHARAKEASPRKWCLEQGVDAVSSSRRLNDFLAAESRRRGLPWVEPIHTLHWRPNPLLLNEEKAGWLREETRRIFELTGIHIGPSRIADPVETPCHS